MKTRKPITSRVNKRDNFIVRILKGAALLLREIIDFGSFFGKTPKEEKKIVFYAENAGYYPYFEGIIERLLKEHNQTLCYITSDPQDSIFQRKEPRIRPFYSDKLLAFLMAFVDCKVFVMTLLDLNQFHLKRSVSPVQYVYVFHSLLSTHMVYRYGAFDHYDSILCCGPHQVGEIRRHEQLYGLRPKQLVEAGYYRLERVFEAYQKYMQHKPSSHTRGVILIAPSWGVANILESCGEKLVGSLLEAGYKVIVRPHPEAIKHAPGLTGFFNSKFGDNPNFTLETSVATDTSLLEADVLISDYSGIVLEYAFGTERPVLFLDVPAKVKNPRYKELGIEPLVLAIRSKIGTIVAPEKINTVPEEISKLMAEKEAYKNRIVELRKRYLYAFGHSSQIGARHIMDLLKRPQ